MIVRRWVDARVLVGGWDCSGDAGTTELIVNMQMEQTTTLSMGCRTYIGGKTSTSFRHTAFGAGSRLVRPPDLRGVPISVITGQWVLFFLADTVRAIRRAAQGESIEMVDIEAQSDSMTPPIYGRLGTVPFGNGKHVFSVMHDLICRTSEFLSGAIPARIPDHALVAAGTR